MTQLAPKVLENSRVSREDLLADGPTVRAKPQSLYLDVSNRCNLRCIMCPYHWNGKDQLKEGDVMPEEVFYRIGAELFPTARNVYLYGGGEVFLHPHWDAMFDFARQWTFLPIISTHGGLFTDRRIAALVDAGTQLRISFDGATPQTFDKIRVGGDFHQVVANIRRIQRYREQNAPGGRFLIRFSVTSFDENVHELPDIVALAADLGVEQVIFHHLMTDRNPLEGHQLHHMPTASDEAFCQAAERGAELGVHVKVPAAFQAEGELAQRLEAALAKVPPNRHGDYFNYPVGPSEGFTCRVPWVETYIKTNGEVMPCCMVAQNFTLGSVVEASFESVWNSENYQEFRHQVNSPAPASTCTAQACIYRNHQLHQGLIQLDSQNRLRLDSRCPGRLHAAMHPLESRTSGRNLRARIRVQNEGDTLWLADREGQSFRGKVRLGLKTINRSGTVLADYARVTLEHDVEPGDSAELNVQSELPDGASGFLLDMVSEGISWFEPHGSTALRLLLEEPSLGDPVA